MRKFGVLESYKGFEHLKITAEVRGQGANRIKEAGARGQCSRILCHVSWGAGGLDPYLGIGTGWEPGPK